MTEPDSHTSGGSRRGSSRSRRASHRRRRSLAAAVVVAALAAACSGGDSDEPVELTMLTYDSFAAPPSLTGFSQATGIAVTVVPGGDTGTLVNKAILTAGNPEGDVLWGIDSILLSRADDARLFDPYVSDAAEFPASLASLTEDGIATPVDTADVCLNYDLAWFRDHRLDPPASLDALADPAYRDLLVVPNPASSSPGLAFMLATIAHYGEDGFAEFWTSLRDNGLVVVESWDAAYFTEFTAGGGGGSRPIVVSYASSPPFGVVDGAATTAAIVDPGTCYRVVEFAGVLRGSKHVAEARRLIDFLVGEDFQAELPETNYVYPVREGTPLPELFETFAPPARDPALLDPDLIAGQRDAWIELWTATVLG